MNYELAKKLKDAGFPQHEGGGSGITHINATTNAWVYDNEAFYLPTLSELIEACGAQYFLLQKKGTKLWYACVKEHEWSDGLTPEEAVSNLWLALNKKKPSTEVEG